MVAAIFREGGCALDSEQWVVGTAAPWAMGSEDSFASVGEPLAGSWVMNGVGCLTV